MRRVILLLVVLSVAFAPAPFPKPNRQTDLEKLQGEWVTVKSVLEGDEVKLTPGRDTAVFKGDQISFVTGGTVSARWTITLGPAQQPRTLDLRGAGATNFILGIYRLEGDTLTLCNRNLAGGKDRPGDFTGRKGVWLAVYKRSKR
jgi:uncharacterized protein (TIGR03067 family)